MIRENQRLLHRLDILLDGLIVFFSFLSGYWFRFYVLHDGVISVTFRKYLLVAALLIPLHLATYHIAGMYGSRRRDRLSRELGRLFWLSLLDFSLLQMFLFLTKDVNFSRLALLFFFCADYFLLSAKRIVLRKLLRYIRTKGYNQKCVVIVGSGETAVRLTEELLSSPELGYRIMGCVSAGGRPTVLEHLGDFSALDDLLLRLKPDEVFAGLAEAEYMFMPAIISACEHSGTKLSLIPLYAQYMPAHPQFDSLNGIPLINLRRIPLDNIGNALLKRTMDVVGSLLLILLFSPVMLITAIGVRLSSPGPVIFRQKRVGLNKKEFYLYKFRSMRVSADADTAWSTNVDPRRTRFGSLIRKYSLDELPQFFNVLRGDMSLVGPRPEIPYFVDRFKDEIPLYMVKHQVRPGITGWAQVNGLRGDTSIPERIRHDIYYIENWSLLFDFKILFLTVLRGFANQEVPN